MEALKSFVNFLSYPQWSFTLTLVLFAWLVWSKRVWTKAGGWAMLFVGTVALALAILDPNFRVIVTKPDNVPIVMMVFSGGLLRVALHVQGDPQRSAHRTG